MRSLVFRLNVTPTPLVDPRPADVLPHVIGSKFKFIPTECHEIHLQPQPIGK